MEASAGLAAAHKGGEGADAGHAGDGGKFAGEAPKEGGGLGVFGGDQAEFVARGSLAEGGLRGGGVVGVEVALEEEEAGEKGFPREDVAEGPKFLLNRLLEEIVVSVCLQMNCVWADGVVQDFEEELGEGVEVAAGEAGNG